jgi:hypothetical protein
VDHQQQQAALDHRTRCGRRQGRLAASTSAWPRAEGAPGQWSRLYGIQVVGANNKVAWNSVAGNGGAANSAGIRVESTGNDLRGGTVSGNTGDGVQISRQHQ